MPYKEFEPKDSLEACLTKLWGDTREVNPTDGYPASGTPK